MKETPTAAINLPWIRAQFPSLMQTVNGNPSVFLDGPGGTQVPQSVIDAMSGYLKTNNANTHGAYATSRRTDEMIASARAAMADFLNCDSDEIVLGQNMTTLTYAISRSIGRDLRPGDEIVLTYLDHDANISPWRALEEGGVSVRFVEINRENCTLDMTDLARKLTKRTKLVAVGYASNAVGTINDVREITRLAHQMGALTYIDAVHYAPHAAIDVRALDCDFLVCSTYKFFGPHMGVLYGKREHLKRLAPYKVRANTDEIPNCWEWGTLNHECIAGIGACVDYIASIGRQVEPEVSSRRQAVLAAYAAIREQEHRLMGTLMTGLMAIPSLRLYGITEARQFDQRCPTVALRVSDHAPGELAEMLGERGFFTWHGNFYALNLTEKLGVEKDGGFLRIGLTHYNTDEEVTRLLSALREILS